MSGRTRIPQGKAWYDEAYDLLGLRSSNTDGYIGSRGHGAVFLGAFL